MSVIPTCKYKATNERNDSVQSLESDFKVLNFEARCFYLMLSALENAALLSNTESL